MLAEHLQDQTDAAGLSKAEPAAAAWWRDTANRLVNKHKHKLVSISDNCYEGKK